MKRGGGAAKGSAYERALCRSWGLFWSEGKRDDLFWRTSGSGSRATNLRRLNRKLTKFQHGDMTFIHPDGRLLLEHFNFEFKRYKRIEIHSVLYPTGPDNSLLAFWGQCVKDADKSGRWPILITRVDRGREVCWVRRETYTLFLGLGFGAYPHIRFEIPEQMVILKRKSKKCKAETYKLEAQEVFGFLLDDFFDQVDPVNMRCCLAKEGGSIERQQVLRDDTEA